jgi:hypothetical protein
MHGMTHATQRYANEQRNCVPMRPIQNLSILSLFVYGVGRVEPYVTGCVHVRGDQCWIMPTYINALTSGAAVRIVYYYTD